jgi:hypothetical protein
MAAVQLSADTPAVPTVAAVQLSADAATLPAVAAVQLPADTAAIPHRYALLARRGRRRDV